MQTIAEPTGGRFDFNEINGLRGMDLSRGNAVAKEAFGNLRVSAGKMRNRVNRLYQLFLRPI